jgi:hypothetical protein
MLLATLINPSGLEGLLFPFKLMSMSALSFISEWSSATFNRLGPFEVLLLVVLFFCLIRGVRVPLIRLTLLLGMLHMALAHRRFTIVFAIGAALLLAEPIAAALKPRSKDIPASSIRLRTAAGRWHRSCRFCRYSSCDAVAITVITDTDVSLASVPVDVPQPVFNDYDCGSHPRACPHLSMARGRGVYIHAHYARLASGQLTSTVLAKLATWAIVHTGHRRAGS